MRVQGRFTLEAGQDLDRLADVMKNKLSLLALFTAFSFHPLLWAEETTAPRVDNDPDMLDFWVGEWDLTWEGKDGPAKGTNAVTKVLNGAAIHESFVGKPGMDFFGKSYSVLSRADGRWKQVWVDSARGYLDFDGYREGDKVVFHRQGKNPQGEDILQRMVFHDIKKDSLIWDWETSPSGEEWTLRWRIHYQRKKD